MNSADIRKTFLDYFADKGHRIVPSSPVVPQDDPTLLFTNAGMNQFKNVFIGIETRDYTRAASAQKCIRAGGKHNDLDQVGLTARHQTFFEMLGNFSFGDYFKEDAIAFAWELVVKGYGLDPKRLYATIYKDDDEAEKIWRKVAPEIRTRILRFGEKDNFWAMGDTGPCGPCSEIHYDRGEHIPGELNGEGDRFMEIWNLVFMQYNRDESGKLMPLPKPSVDTGAGLERFCMVLQSVDSNYDTDLFKPLLETIENLSNKPYVRGPDGVPHRVIADHSRALAFAIADNAIISNEGRGYVLRRILRRAARYGHQLGLREPFIYKLVAPLASKMGDIYPELKTQRGRIELVIKSEEEQFNRTLDNGIARFEDIAGRTSKIIPGEDVFRLYDTYGFPPDLTEIMAREKGLAIDWGGFEKELEKQRERSRAASGFASVNDGVSLASITGKKSRFVGYDSAQAETMILAAAENMIYLEDTPFYAEAGGQVGDTGVIENERLKFIVEDTKKRGDDITHYGRFVRLAEGLTVDKSSNERVIARIDFDRRADIQRNHTATHLLHKALRTVLGEHVQQSGSLVAPDKLRFDFSHFRAMTPEEIEAVEEIVNEKIKADLPVRWQMMPLEEAKKLGAMALFGEKYGDTVRVVKTGDFSMELCGGCHVTHTSDIGGFFIVSESAIAAGIRRIEAITGTEERKFWQSQDGLCQRLGLLLRLPNSKLNLESIAEIKSLRNEIHPRVLNRCGLTLLLEETLEKITKMEKEQAKTSLRSIEEKATSNVPVLKIPLPYGILHCHKVPNENPDEFMPYFDVLKARNNQNTGNNVTFAVSEITGQFAIYSPEYASANAVKEVLVNKAGARGGGKPTIRGSIPPANIDKAIAALKEKFQS